MVEAASEPVPVSIHPVSLSIREPIVPNPVGVRVDSVEVDPAAYAPAIAVY